MYAWAKAATKPTYTAAEVGAATLADITSAIQALDSTASISEGNFITGFDVVDGKVTNVTYGAPETVAIPTYTLTSTSEGNVTITGGDTNSTVAINGFSTIAGLARSAVQEIATGSANGTISVDGSDVAVKGLGSAAYTDASAYANAAMGELANTAVQPGDLGSAAYNESTDFATAVQGALAASALQPADITTGTTRGAISVDGTAVAVNGLGNAAYVNTDAFDAAGTAAGIGSAINGVVSAMNTRLNGAETNISTLQTKVNDLGNALHFVGAGNTASRPEDGEDGDVYLDTETNIEYVYSNGAWVEFGNPEHLTKAQADGYYAPINILSSNYSGTNAQTITSITATNGVITVSSAAINIPSTQVSGLGALATKDTVEQSEVNGLSTTLAAINSNIGSSITDAIGAIDGVITNAAGANMALNAFSQADGVVTAEFVPIAIAATQVTSGVFADARIPTLAISKITGLQDALDDKLESADIADLATKEEVNAKQDALSGAQLNAVNSGITAAKVGTYDGYAAKINALEAKPGLDKVGTVTSVAGANGIKVTGTATTTPVVEIDTAAVFTLDCGTATTNID